MSVTGKIISDQPLERQDTLVRFRERIIRRRSNVPARYLRGWYEPRFPLDDSPEAATCRYWITSFLENEEHFGRGIVFYGTPGTGKTTLAVTTMVTALITPTNHLTMLGIRTFGSYAPYRPGYFIGHTDLLQVVYDSWSKDAESARDLKRSLYGQHTGDESYRNTKVLVLDDVGKENPNQGSGHKQQVMHEVLRGRYDRDMSTLITTNLGPDKWAEAYGLATADFLREAFIPVPMNGRSRR